METAKPARAVHAVTAATRAEPRLTQAQNEALLAVYSSYPAEGKTKSAKEFTEFKNALRT